MAIENVMAKLLKIKICTVSFILSISIHVLGYSATALTLEKFERETKMEKIASDENKNIILVFQGSDWCAPCIKLDREIWNTTEFKNYAKENFVLLKADFPRKSKNKLSEIQKENNKKLMEQYNTRGYFPFVVVLDKNGKAIGTTGYKKTTPTAFIDLLTSF